jgi:hypothetical protein
VAAGLWCGRRSRRRRRAAGVPVRARARPGRGRRGRRPGRPPRAATARRGLVRRAVRGGRRRWRRTPPGTGPRRAAPRTRCAGLRPRPAGAPRGDGALRGRRRRPAADGSAGRRRARRRRAGAARRDPAGAGRGPVPRRQVAASRRELRGGRRPRGARAGRDDLAAAAALVVTALQEPARWPRTSGSPRTRCARDAGHVGPGPAARASSRRRTPDLGTRSRSTSTRDGRSSSPQASGTTAPCWTPSRAAQSVLSVPSAARERLELARAGESAAASLGLPLDEVHAHVWQADAAFELGDVDRVGRRGDRVARSRSAPDRCWRAGTTCGARRRSPRCAVTSSRPRGLGGGHCAAEQVGDRLGRGAIAGVPAEPGVAARACRSCCRTSTSPPSSGRWPSRSPGRRRDVPDDAGPPRGGRPEYERSPACLEAPWRDQRWGRRLGYLTDLAVPTATPTAAAGCTSELRSWAATPSASGRRQVSWPAPSPGTLGRTGGDRR